MAIGDVVAQIFVPPAAGNYYLQPAAGVGIMITEIVIYSYGAAGAVAGLTDGTNNMAVLTSTAAGTFSGIYKLFINNTVYFYFYAHVTSDRAAVSGVQSK